MSYVVYATSCSPPVKKHSTTKREKALKCKPLVQNRLNRDDVHVYKTLPLEYESIQSNYTGPATEKAREARCTTLTHISGSVQHPVRPLNSLINLYMSSKKRAQDCCNRPW